MMQYLMNQPHYFTLSFSDIIARTVTSIILGFLVASIYRYKNKYSQNLSFTLVLLPAIVQIIIMFVDGNIGVGISVAGAFSLIRFRSIAGTSKDISFIFFAMALGFVTGLGLLTESLIFLVIIGIIALLLIHFNYGEVVTHERILRIKIPENLDYENLFDDLFEKYSLTNELENVKTIQMGSLYELTYIVRLRDDVSTKEFMDEIRQRNGNLSVMIGRESKSRSEL